MRARLAALAVLALFAAVAWRYAAGLQQVAAIGAPAPDFSLPDLNGETVTLSDLRGRPVLVNFWATWCPPCIEEAPALETLHQRYGDRLAILGVDHLEAAPAVAQFRERFGLTYPLLLDRNGAVGERYSVRALPETWFIDAGGTARLHRAGAVTFEDIQSWYQQAVGVPIDGSGVGPVPAGGHAFDLEPAAGRLWVAVHTGLATADPRDGAHLEDASAWAQVEGLDLPVHTLLTGHEPDPANPSGTTLWAATTDGVWVYSTDPGDGEDPWRPGGLQGRPVLGLALAPGGRQGLGWVPGEGLYRLEQDEWIFLPTDLDEDLGALALAADPDRPDRWLAGFAAGLLESRDGGSSWRVIGPERAVFDLYFAGDALYLATDRGIWRSLDGGITAEPLGGPMRAFSAVAGVEDGTLWALAPNGDLYRRNGDGSWRREGRDSGSVAWGGEAR